MDKFKLSPILQFLLLLIPVDIYVIGEWVGSGIQWVLFRYIVVDNQSALIVLPSEVVLVLNGTINGQRTVFSEIFWFFGACLLLLAFLSIAFSYVKRENKLLKQGALIDAGAGIFFLIALFIQYGFALHGPAGFVIPIGLPILFIIAYWLYRESGRSDDEETAHEKESEMIS
ncbi:MAG: hypothetical protein ABSG49_06750 [Methanoregula sp.]|jgi:hypothetical protein|uniref:hypothetical protein n=1 Tax=Methanoregula sp. TaxID=2052170 RepID=UPI003C1A7309